MCITLSEMKILIGPNGPICDLNCCTADIMELMPDSSTCIYAGYEPVVIIPDMSRSKIIIHNLDHSDADKLENIENHMTVVLCRPNFNALTTSKHINIVAINPSRHGGRAYSFTFDNLFPQMSAEYIRNNAVEIIQELESAHPEMNVAVRSNHALILFCMKYSHFMKQCSEWKLVTTR